MGKITGKLTVFFEAPFWVGIFERSEDGKLSAAKVTFGSEPKDYDIYEFILEHYDDLQFSPSVAAAAGKEKRNPKRRLREARNQMLGNGVGTKAQQALKLQQEQGKQERRAKSREQKLAEEKRKCELKQHKKKEKQRGH